MDKDNAGSEQGDCFIYVARLLGEGFAAGAIATAIEQEGIFTRDRFNRLVRSMPGSEEETPADYFLEIFGEFCDEGQSWHLDPGLSDREFMLFTFGWPKKDLPDFSALMARDELSGMASNSLGEIEEGNVMQALAVMAWLLAENKSSMMIGGRPNAKAIGEAVDNLAIKFFGKDVRGFKSFNKKISEALKLLDGGAVAKK